MPTSVELSSGESEILGLKIGRCNSDYFDEVSLYDVIVQGNYDLCRLRVPAEDEMAPLRLHKTGLPFFFSGSIRRYKTKISEPPPGNYNVPDLIFEQYDGSQVQLLRDMLVGTWGTYPIGYYRTPYLQNLATKEREIECVFQYYKKHNNTKNYPNNSIMFIKHGDDYVGFFALNIVGTNLESHVGGILEPYRKLGYFLDKLRYIKEFCLKNRLENFIFGARNENADVQRIFQYVGFQPRGSENVFHIPSLLTYSQREVLKTEVPLDNRNSAYLYQSILTHSLSHAGDISGLDLSFHLNQSESLLKKSLMKMRISYPIVTEDEYLMVLREDEEAASSFTGYLRAFKR
jgi:hypothetical protein